MTVITIAEADVVALGGRAPVVGRIDLWRVAPGRGGVKLGSHRMAGAEIDLGVWPPGTALHLLPRSPGMAGSWTVQVPDVPTITLADLITNHQVDLDTLTGAIGNSRWAPAEPLEQNLRPEPASRWVTP
jgi:hypothetical protein